MNNQKTKMEEFDHEIYQMISPNNMQTLSEFEPVNTKEQEKIDEAFRIGIK